MLTSIQKLVQMVFVSFLIMLPMIGAHCPPSRGYYPNFANVTSEKFRLDELEFTTGGVMYKIPSNVDEARFKAALDVQTEQLEFCLEKANPKWKVERQWFAVIVPANWYKSTCSGQQMIPSRAWYKLCEQKKICDTTKVPPVCVPVKIPEHCRGVVVPTKECPCPCNFRSAVQVRWAGAPLPAVVTAPELRLYKAELASLVTGVRNVWTNDTIKACLR